MAFLADPEADWERAPSTRIIARDEVERRIGANTAPLQVLGGGHANVNIRVGTERVLRIYRRDRRALAREKALLSHPWGSFRVPRLLADGEDFLLLEYVHHRPLSDVPEHGAAAGRALAEIHSTGYQVAGHFGVELEVADPLPDFPAAVADHVQERLQTVSGETARELRRLARRLFDRELPRLRAAAGAPVLLHGDFKPSNVHCASGGTLLVLDWEFALAGPALMDLGQLMRWRPSPTFCEAAATAYRTAGGQLSSDWLRWAQVLDLGNLAGLLATATPGSRRAEDLVRRIRRTLQHEAGDPVAVREGG